MIRISLDQNDTSSDVDVATSDVGDSSADSGDTTSTRVTDPSKSSDYIDVVYDDSLMLKRLAIYPFVQLGVVMLFVVVAIFALLTSKKRRTEQSLGGTVGRKPPISLEPRYPPLWLG